MSLNEFGAVVRRQTKRSVHTEITRNVLHCCNECLKRKNLTFGHVSVFSMRDFFCRVAKALNCGARSLPAWGSFKLPEMRITLEQSWFLSAVAMQGRSTCCRTISLARAHPYLFS
jgi:hypothetical protein